MMRPNQSVRGAGCIEKLEDRNLLSADLVHLQNPEDHYDVNGDGGHTIADVFAIVRYLQSHSEPIATPHHNGAYYDVNGDGHVSHVDLHANVMHLIVAAHETAQEAVEEGLDTAREAVGDALDHAETILEEHDHDDQHDDHQGGDHAVAEHVQQVLEDVEDAIHYHLDQARLHLDAVFPEHDDPDHHHGEPVDEVGEGEYHYDEQPNEDGMHVWHDKLHHWFDYVNEHHVPLGHLADDLHQLLEEGRIALHERIGEILDAIDHHQDQVHQRHAEAIAKVHYHVRHALDALEHVGPELRVVHGDHVGEVVHWLHGLKTHFHDGIDYVMHHLGHFDHGCDDPAYCDDLPDMPPDTTPPPDTDGDHHHHHLLGIHAKLPLLILGHLDRLL